jgi:hypothetical protein
MQITLTMDGRTTRTWFRSLLSVKRWATRYQHAWQMRGEDLIVSVADGSVLIYRPFPKAESEHDGRQVDRA